MHVSLAKHSFVWLPRKCDFRTDTQIHTCTRTDRHPTKWSGDKNMNRLVEAHLTQSPTELFAMVWLAALPYTVPYRAVCDGVVGGLTLHSPLQSCLWWCGWRPYLTQSPTELFVMVWLAALPYTVPYRAVCDGVVGGVTLHSPLQSCLWWCGWRPHLTQSPTKLFVMVWLAALPYTVPYRAVCDGVVGGLTLRSPLQSCLWWRGRRPFLTQSPTELFVMVWLAALPYTVPYRAVCGWWRGWRPVGSRSPGAGFESPSDLTWSLHQTNHQKLGICKRHLS